MINNKVMAVLDADSSEYDQFDDIDKRYLEEVVDILVNGDSIWPD